MANDIAGCSWRSSCKSPRTLQKCNLLITRQLTFGAVLGEHKLSLPSTRLKVNHLCIRCLCFESVRGDLQEGQGCASRCQLPLFPVPIPVSPSTKSRFLCSSRGTSGIGKRKSDLRAIHRAGQCAPEVPRTRIRARGDLQELRNGQPATSLPSDT